MREVLILLTIALGQVAPSGHLFTELTNKLKLEPVVTSKKESVDQTDLIKAEPNKIIHEDYTASAKSVYSIDMASNAVLASKDIDTRLQVASLSKLMTAYVILKEERDLTRTIKVTNLELQAGDSTMGLRVDDTPTIRDLLDGLLITSGSDAAQTLAIGNAGSVKTFVDKMNTDALSLNLKNTHFTNPVGWDDSDNYSSVHDLTELTRILLRNKTFTEIISTKSKNLSLGGRNIVLETTNLLLYKPGFVGVKTGYTYGAGECLVSLYVDGNTQILTTVLDSEARFPETEAIKGWILGHFSW